jgi:hypothetical protein
MDWLLANPKLLIAAIIICGYAIRLLMRKGAPDDGAQNREANARRARPTTMQYDPAEEERTRRIQEEIRRKIVERLQRGSVTPPPIPQGPIIAEDTSEGPPPLPFPSGRAAFPGAEPVFAEIEDAADTESLVARQRAMLEQLHALQAQRAAGLQIAPAPRFAAAEGASAFARDVREPQTQMALTRDMRALLRNKTNIRRAILLREILGEPPGLQRGPLVLPRR